MLHEVVQLVQTFILFETLAFLKVPELQLVVQGAGQDVATIGGKFDKGHRGVGFIDQCFQALPAITVPNSTEPIIAAGHYERAISVEVHSSDRI